MKAMTSASRFLISHQLLSIPHHTFIRLEHSNDWQINSLISYWLSIPIGLIAACTSDSFDCGYFNQPAKGNSDFDWLLDFLLFFFVFLSLLRCYWFDDQREKRRIRWTHVCGGFSVHKTSEQRLLVQPSVDPTAFNFNLWWICEGEKGKKEVSCKIIEYPRAFSNIARHRTTSGIFRLFRASPTLHKFLPRHKSKGTRILK